MAKGNVKETDVKATCIKIVNTIDQQVESFRKRRERKFNKFLWAARIIYNKERLVKYGFMKRIESSEEMWKYIKKEYIDVDYLYYLKFKEKYDKFRKVENIEDPIHDNRRGFRSTAIDLIRLCERVEKSSGNRHSTIEITDKEAQWLKLWEDKMEEKKND